MIAVAVVAWITGVFGTTAAGGEQLQVFPNGTLKNESSKWNLSLTIYNKGASASSITGASVGNVSCTGTGTIGPGNTSTISFDCGGTGIAPGVTYTVKIYTAAGNVYFTQVVAG